MQLIRTVERLGLAGAAMLVFQSPAAAQQHSWRAGSASNVAESFIDTLSIRREGDRVRFVRELRLNEAEAFDDGQRYDLIGSLMEVDCRARTIRQIELWATMAGRTVVDRSPAGDEAMVVDPESTGDMDLRAVCFNEWPDRSPAPAPPVA